MCFYNCPVNISRILNQISNYAELLAKEKTSRLNLMVIPYAHKSENRDFDIESWEEWSDVSKISENATMKLITPTKRTTKQNKDNIEEDSESDQESVFINPYGILSEEDEKNDMNEILDATTNEHRAYNIKEKTMHDEKCDDASNSEIKLKNAEAKNEINAIVPLNDKLIMEYDE